MNASGQAAERARLHELMAVSEAERTVAAARMAELVAAQAAAWRRHRAAKGLVTRALKDGNADKIAAAQERERRAYAEAEAIADDGISEMFVINGAGMNRLGELLSQTGRAWEADAEAMDHITGPEAG